MTLVPSLAGDVGAGTIRIDQCGPDTVSGRYMREFWTPSHCSTTWHPGAPATSTSSANISPIIAGKRALRI